MNQNNSKKNGVGNLKSKTKQGFDPEKLFENAKKIITENNCIFMSDVYMLMGISHDTFYKYFTPSSEKMEELKLMLNNNKVKDKITSRQKFKESDNATLNLVYYKLIASDEELKRLNTNFTVSSENETGNDNIYQFRFDD